MEACAFVNSQIEEVNSGGGVLVCEPKVRMKCVEASEKGSEFLYSAWPDEEDVICVARNE